MIVTNFPASGGGVFGQGINLFGLHKEIKFNSSNSVDEDIYGIKITSVTNGSANAPHPGENWGYSRIENFGTPNTYNTSPYWVTVSGEIYFSGGNAEETLDVAIEYADDVADTIIMKITNVPQKFVLHFYSKYFHGYHTSSHGYMDIDCDHAKMESVDAIYISHLKVELGKEYYPIWTPAPEDVEYRLKQLEGKGAPAADPGMSGTDGPE